MSSDIRLLNRLPVPQVSRRLDSRLGEGPLRVRTFWDEELTAQLPARALTRRREQFVRRSALGGTLALAGVFVCLLRFSPFGDHSSTNQSDFGSSAGSGQIHPSEVGETGAHATPPHDAGSSSARHERTSGEPVASLKEVSAEEQTAAFIQANARAEQRNATPKPSQNVSEVSSTRPSKDWRALAKESSYTASYDLMKSVGADVEQSAADLMLAADVARLSNHPQEAAGLLLKVSQKFPGDPRAPLAEFTRGRVLLENLGQAGAAASAFARARTLSPQGSLASDALIREMDASLQSGQEAHAKSLARLYLSSYPEGRHRAKCEKLVSAD